MQKIASLLDEMHALSYLAEKTIDSLETTSA